MEQKDRSVLLCVRLCVGLLAALLVAFCIVSALAVPRMLQTLDHMNRTLTSIDELAVTAENALSAANSAADAANALVAENADAVSEAMEKFNSVDFDALNKAIRDLADIVEPLAKVSNFFSK